MTFLEGRSTHLGNSKWIFNIDDLRVGSNKLPLIFENLLLPNSPEFREWFAGSLVKEDDTPLVVFHATTNLSFTQFDRNKSELGIHFGTLAQSRARGLRQAKDKNVTKVRIIPVCLRILRFMDMIDGSWRISDVYDSLGNQTELSREHIMKIAEERQVEALGTAEKLYPSSLEARQKFQQQRQRELCYEDIMSFGFDGFKYINEVEARGDENISWVVFSDEQVWWL